MPKLHFRHKPLNLCFSCRLWTSVDNAHNMNPLAIHGGLDLVDRYGNGYIELVCKREETLLNNEAFTIRSFCQAYGVGRSFTYSEMAAGKLSYRKAGKRTLIMRDDAQRWADNLPKGGPQNAETA